MAEPKRRIVAKAQLDAAAAVAGVSEQQSQALWAELEQRCRASWSGPSLSGVVTFTGGLLVLSAVTWLIGTQLLVFGESLPAFVLMLMLAFWGGGHAFWAQPRTRVIGGLLLTVALALVPLLVWSLHDFADWHPLGDLGGYSGFYRWIESGWLTLELVTLAASAAMLYRYPFPFMTLIPAVMIWFVAMDLTLIVMEVLALGSGWDLYFEARRATSMIVGAAIIGAAWYLDLRTRRDFQFWLYLAGMTAFWGGLTSGDPSGELAVVGYGLVNAALVVFAVYLRRRVIMVYGGIGIALALGTLGFTYFNSSLGFIFVLGGLGLGLMALGNVLLQRRAEFERRVEANSTAWLTRIRPHLREPHDLDAGAPKVPAP